CYGSNSTTKHGLHSAKRPRPCGPNVQAPAMPAASDHAGSLVPRHLLRERYVVVVNLLLIVQALHCLVLPQEGQGQKALIEHERIAIAGDRALQVAILIREDRVPHV